MDILKTMLVAIVMIELVAAALQIAIVIGLSCRNGHFEPLIKPVTLLATSAKIRDRIILGWRRSGNQPLTPGKGYWSMQRMPDLKGRGEKL
jgi:hypothetical protein